MVMKESNLYYFYSIGCAYCNKAEPIVDELNKEDHDILKLDIAEKENKEILEVLKKKYNIQCGTPLFLDAETGHHVCGYREKDIMLKWIAGEEIPPPPRPKSPAPRVPWHGSSKGDENNWKVEYEKWTEENSHLPNLKTPDELLAMPRPKSAPPPLPKPGYSNNEFKKWRTAYKKWYKENNDHMPNLTTVDDMGKRVENMLKNKQPMPQQMNPNSNLERRIQLVESKLDRLMKHLGVK